METSNFHGYEINDEGKPYKYISIIRTVRIQVEYDDPILFIYVLKFYFQKNNLIIIGEERTG